MEKWNTAALEAALGHHFQRPDLLHRASALSRQAGLLLEEGRTRGARRYAINSRQALPARPGFYQQPQSPLAGQDPRRRAAGRQQAAPELEA